MTTQELIDLKNLGKTSVQWLKAVGISTPEQLREVGAVGAFCKIKQRGFRVSKVLLYALYGALHNVEWKTLSKETKNLLYKAVNEAGVSF